MKINKKGVGLVVAIMIVLVLCIMGVGLIHMTNYSTSSTQKTIRNLQTYWAAESAANYNINWWKNQPESLRIFFPYNYVAETFSKAGEKTVYNDKNYDYDITPDLFEGATGTVNGELYYHASSLFSGNPFVNPELRPASMGGTGQDGYIFYLQRYKGERIGTNLSPGDAVWVLESTAIRLDDNNRYSDACKITYSNVYNINIDDNLELLNNAEAIIQTMRNAGFHGRKGFFGQWDYRYGNCYFATEVFFDYANTGGSSQGPTFYGSVRSASPYGSTYGIGNTANPAKLDINNPDHAPYYQGINMMGVKDADDVKPALESSLLGEAPAYEWGINELSTENIYWDWQSYVKHSGEMGIYRIYDQLGPSGANKIFPGDDIDIKLEVKTDASGQKLTTANVYRNKKFTKPVVQIPISNSAGGWRIIAVDDIYGDVGINGVSSDDFSLVTQGDPIHITGDFYLDELDYLKDYVEGMSDYDVASPERDELAKLYDGMVETRPDGHLALMSCIDQTMAANTSRENSFFITQEETLFLNTVLLSLNGGIAAAGGVGTSNNSDLAFFNIGAHITLVSQDDTEGGESAKYPLNLVQDARYEVYDDEPIPPGMGVRPDAYIGEVITGRNPKYRWSKHLSGDCKSFVYPWK